MRPFAVVVLLVAGCTRGETDSTLSIDGPVRVRVETLGPVDGPRFVLSDGTAPEGLVIEVAPTHVARLKGEEVVAVGRGEAVVTGRWKDQTAAWDLVVAPAITLSFADPPMKLAVGDSAPLVVKGAIGGEPAIVVDVDWSVQPEGIVAIEPGRVVGLAPGTAWISATHGKSEAMLEIEVLPARASTTDVPESP